MRLSNKELNEVSGGKGISFGFALIVSGIISFIAGFLSGVSNPTACHK